MAESFSPLAGLCGHFGRHSLEKNGTGRPGNVGVSLDRNGGCRRFAPVSRLTIRHKRHADIYEAFLQLGCILICWKFIHLKGFC